MRDCEVGPQKLFDNTNIFLRKKLCISPLLGLIPRLLKLGWFFSFTVYPQVIVLRDYKPKYSNLGVVKVR